MTDFFTTQGPPEFFVRIFSWKLKLIEINENRFTPNISQKFEKIFLKICFSFEQLPICQNQHSALNKYHSTKNEDFHQGFL